LSVTEAAASPGSRSQRSRKPRQQHTA
jgi:hypothetical protein